MVGVSGGEAWELTKSGVDHSVNQAGAGPGRGPAGSHHFFSSVRLPDVQ